jgi:hypothetical protein
LEVRARTVWKALYVFALGLLAVSVLQIIVEVWPPHPGSMNWRYGAFGLVTNSLLSALTALAVAVALATALEQRRVLRTLALVALVAAVFWIAASGLFTMDYLQLRSRIKPQARLGFDLASVRALAIALVSAFVTFVVGVAGWRATRIPRMVGARTRKRDEEVGIITRHPTEEGAT